MNENLSWKEWKKGDWHLINRIRWDKKEVKSLERVLEGDWFGYGEINKECERKLSDYTGIKNFHLTNSGSSAIQAGLLSLKHQGYWERDDLVLHPITTFATSISSAVFLGMVPVYIDTKPYTYVADPEKVEKAIKKYPQIKGMVLPHLLGSIADINRIKNALEDRFLIEDCCDTIGGTYDGRHIGSFGEFAAFSFYASHHITGGGSGGALATKDDVLHNVARSCIYWGRNFKEGDEEFLKRYNYSTLGTNSQMPALLASFVSAQLERLPGFVEDRAKQFREMNELFAGSSYFHLPDADPKAKPSWFAYPLTVKAKAPFTRSEFARYLTKNKVEVRPVMCGNIMEQAPFRKVKCLTVENHFPAADEIEERGLFVPCWGMSEEQKEDYYKIYKNFFARYSGRKGGCFS